MSRCFECFQDSCYYRFHCSCNCHADEDKGCCETCGQPAEFTRLKKCKLCRAVEERLANYLLLGKRKAKAFVKKALEASYTRKKR